MVEVVSAVESDADKVLILQLMQEITKTDERVNSSSNKLKQDTTWMKMIAFAAKVEREPETNIAKTCRFVFHRKHRTDGTLAGTKCGNEIMVSSWKMAKYERAKELGIPEDKWYASWKPSFRCGECKEALLDRREKEDGKRLRDRSPSNE